MRCRCGGVSVHVSYCEAVAPALFSLTEHQLTKNVLQKQSKNFYKKIDQKSKTDFFSNFILSRLWAFLGEGSIKTRLKKY
jgi:hypothetical protein